MSGALLLKEFLSVLQERLENSETSESKAFAMYRYNIEVRAATGVDPHWM